MLRSGLGPLEDDADDLVLNQEDVVFGLNGNIPTVDFASHILDSLNKRMGFAVVVKLLGRSIGYGALRSKILSLWKPKGRFQLTDLHDDCFLVKFKDDMDFHNALSGGPWVIFGHYLSVQPWTPSFSPQNHKISEIVAWIRLPMLPVRYYQKKVIRTIGSAFGEILKVDFNTDSGDRARFARFAAVLDLTKPLTSKIQVDGQTLYVEYEGLPTICFSCGRYGHLVEACPLKSTGVACPPEGTSIDNRESLEFGDWMQVQNRRRIPVRPGRREVSQKDIPVTSRFTVLQDSEDVIEDQIPRVVPDQPILPCETAAEKRKGRAPKTPFITGHAPRSKGKVQVEPSTSASQPHQTTLLASSFSGSRHSAIRIEDPRLPHRPPPTPSSPPLNLEHFPPLSLQIDKGPAKLNSKPPDLAASHNGVRVSSRLHIHNVEARSNGPSQHTSIKSIRNLARDRPPEMTREDIDQLLEGVNFDSSFPSL